MLTVTEPPPVYHPGLEGVIAGESAICAVDPNAGLLYRGYDIHELAASATFEDIVWLLLNEDLPTPAQAQQTRANLLAECTLPDPVVDMLRLLPPYTHPIDALRTGVSMLAPFDPDLIDNSHAANVRKSLRLIAKVTALTVSIRRLAQGWPPVRSPAGPSLAACFLRGFFDHEPEPWQTRAFDIILLLYAEHEFNASTFAARVTVSTLSDIYAGLTSAIGTLKGPLHGEANEESVGMLRQITSPAAAESWIKQRLAARQKIMGFGHRVYRQGDSRVPIMRDLVRQLEGQRAPSRIAICEALEAVMAREKNVCANVDLYAAPALDLLEFPPQFNTLIFACARASGWCAHIIEQHDHNRLIRPRAEYTGPPRRSRMQRSELTARTREP